MEWSFLFTDICHIRKHKKRQYIEQFEDDVTIQLREI